MSMGIRIRFAKGVQLRFISHLDLLRTMERAVRRAQLPIGYSRGFHPTPRIAYAQALPVGVTSDGEYADMEFTQELPARSVAERLNQVLPLGIRVLEARERAAGAPSLTSIIDAATYIIVFPQMSSHEATQRIAEVLKADTIVVTRQTKHGTKEQDIRPLIYQLRLDTNGETATVELLCAAGSRGNLRPTAMASVLCGDETGAAIHRVQLWARNEQAELVTPFAAVEG